MTGFDSKRQMAQDKLDDDDAQGYIEQYEAALLVSYQSGFADGKRASQPEQQAEPVAWQGFNAWWDAEYDDSDNRFERDSAAYWAWAGWQAAQRPWVGLTDEDLKLLSAEWRIVYGAWMDDFARDIEAKLKERNGY